MKIDNTCSVCGTPVDGKGTKCSYCKTSSKEQ